MASYARRNPSLSNASRNLHALIHKKKKTLPIPITSVTAPVRVSRRRRVQSRPWPVLHLSSWLQKSFESRLYGGFYFLGGNTLDNVPAVEDMLKRFWERFANVEPGDVPHTPARTIPYLLHGDEGRGQCKRPLLVISFQPVFGWTGEEHVNSTKRLGF